MRRNISLQEISDGKLYSSNDMVKADCHDCMGCSKCCRGMGNSIVLDPYDIYRLSNGLHISFQQMLQRYLELNVVDGLTLPNLKMKEDGKCCGFLDQNGRCSIHFYRPGICRLFPLGRYYENESYQYFLQIHECSNQKRSKVKIKKWLDTPRLKEYEQFIRDWHYFLKEAEQYVLSMDDEEEKKNTNLYILMSFYIKSYDEEVDFYQQFYHRLKEAKELLQA
ncbi:MAG: YkgJ family cysteine cluster protein [Lachnospiraceae bacterium]|nr:YkgJ family cysteine cluster protein [Lachnospiraceae bacterium]